MHRPPSPPAGLNGAGQRAQPGSPGKEHLVHSPNGTAPCPVLTRTARRDAPFLTDPPVSEGCTESTDSADQPAASVTDSVLSHADFLQPTRYCDWTHPTIQALAQALTARCSTEREKATTLFAWVRDHIAFEVGNWNRTASETLAAGGGTCTNKANLLVATARAVSIPAGYHVMHVKGQDYLGPVVPDTLRTRISRRSTHVYVTMCLHGQWLRCDPTDDTAFANATAHLNPQSRLVEWEGTNDALLNLDPSHILDEQGPLSTIDHLLARKPRIGRRTVQLGNLYVQFLREQAGSIRRLEALEPAFVRWLRTRSLGYCVLYSLLWVWQTLRTAMRWARGR